MRAIATSILVMLAMTATAQDSQRPKDQSPQRLPTYARSGLGITFFGDGSSGTVYFIDGVQVRNLPAPPVPTLKVPGTYSLSIEEIKRMPYTNIRDMASIFPGIYQQRRGSELNVYAARNDGNRYIVDGMWCY